MKWTDVLKNTFKGMGYSISRFPVTVLFLIAIAILNAFMIEDSSFDFTRLIFTFIIGAMLGIVSQMLYERFKMKDAMRYALFGGTLVLTLVYYLLIGPQVEFNVAISTKTFVLMFALFIAFIWIPTINNLAVPFHRSFLAVIKALFTTLLFTLVLAGGIAAIFSATTYLLFNLDYTILLHLMNIVVSLFTTIYFLSLIPIYPKTEPEDDQGSETKQAVEQFIVPRFLEVLISYIIIPLVGIYTLILVIYVLLNFTGDFWTDNLLEPLLVSYAIIVIIVLILSYNLENRFALNFRKVFPIVLLPIVVFQTIASILKIGEMGITHGRYYVIMFGVFATITGIIFGFLKVKHHGNIAIALLVLALISIIPPIDAFTVSKQSQIRFLEEKLMANNMLEGNTITPKSDVGVADQMAMTKATSYLYDMGYQDEVTFLPDDFIVYNDFEQIFGFSLRYSEEEFEQGMMQYVHLENSDTFIVDIAEYDAMLSAYMNSERPFEPVMLEIAGEMYQVQTEGSEGYPLIQVMDSEGGELLTYNMKAVFDQVFGEEFTTGTIPDVLTVDDAQFETENEQAKMKLLIVSLDRSESYNSAQFYLYLDIKE